MHRQKVPPALLRSRRYQSTSTPFPRPFRFYLGASFAGKPPHPQVAALRRDNVGFPPDSPIARWRDRTLAMRKSVQSRSAGEDFFYIQEGVAFGVADGVGGWVESGVDPSLFSQSLMYHASKYAESAWAGEPESDPSDSSPVEGWELTPKECLEQAHQGVLRDRSVKAGSSTACLIHLNARSGLLRAANLGDSGFAIFRGATLHHVQQPQTHFFNCPWQLAKLPSMTKQYKDAYVDRAEGADEYSTALRGGDVIVAFTDGLSDNVFPAELLSISSLVSRSGVSESQQAQDLADRIVQYAQACMHNKSRLSPFERAAGREGLYYRGGPSVTVVTALVTEEG
ncbi:hypothetical protein SISSUDRAFT_1072613 [Sistotremastrum suecicum HHB10207 ss-3]|uniref:Protein phosphatase n=1 Tax=Sistotremastrum suecicum HHB10207 ss-3 TaxID=1314776 RepID=A0A165WX78_9AGAM|nr:hypothetical protein SISSUDRAFT_1072613 [Sistotremastrum suecicum HHB10207 ss-3]